MERLPKTLLLILSLFCFVFTSCVDSDNPLSDPKQSAVDTGLLGVWRERGKDGQITYYHVGKAGDKFPDGVMRVKVITHNANGELPRPDNDDMLVFTTTLGKNRYLNITGLETDKIKSMGDSKWEPSMAQGYYIYKYEITGDKLAAACMDPSQKREAIKAGKIKGTIDGDKVHITDATENLARFFATADAEKLFFTKASLGDGYAVLERVK